MPAPLVAVLDACVIYPAPLRDLLMELAVSDAFRALPGDAQGKRMPRHRVYVAVRPDQS